MEKLPKSLTSRQDHRRRNFSYGRSFVWHFTFVTAFVFALAGRALANPAAARTFSLDGRLYGSTNLTSPLIDSNVVINVKILNPLGTCVLYEESQVTSTYSTDGYFNVKVGSDVGHLKRTSGDSGHAMAHVFQNSLPIAGKDPSTGAACASYVPLSGDGRKVRITVSPSSGATEVLTPDIEMDSVPMAIVAESVQGLDRSRMLEMGAGSLTQTNVDNVFSNVNYPKLSALLGGTSTDYVRVSGTTGASMPSYTADPAGVAAGQVWLDTTTNQLKFHNGVSVQTISTGTFSGGITSLGGLTSSSQGFVVGVAGTSPAFSSSGTTHTLDLPMASAAGVTAGLLSRTDYDAFNNKLSPTLGTGRIFIGDAINTAIGVLPSGDVGLSVSGVFTLASTGIAPGTYSKVTVDNKGRTLAGGTLAVTDIPGLPASQIISGTLDPLRLPSSAIVDGGNATGAPVVIGTNDSQTFSLESDGVPRITLGTNGYVGIGTNSPAWPFEQSATFNTATANFQHGARFQSRWEAADSNIKTALYATSVASVSGSISSVIGIKSHHTQSSGRSLSVSNFEATTAVNSGTVLNRHGIYVNEPSGSGVLNSQYGVYIESLVKGTTANYAIYTDGTTPSYFGGNVGVGTTTPAAKLEVQGEIKTGNTGLACANGTKGSMRYNDVSNVMEYCNGTSWTVMQSATCSDATPDVFAFTNLVNQTASTLVTSNILQINGVNCTITVSASGPGSPALRICSDAACSSVVQDWTTATSAITAGQYLQLRQTSNATGGVTNSATVIAGTLASSWNVATTGDCSGLPGSPPPIGTVCADGTIYAGLSADGNVPMYTTRCDLGQTWDGSTCTGAGWLQSWNNGAAGTTLLGYTNPSTGKSYSASLAALGGGESPYVAATNCENHVENGHSDWYLPARNELTTLYNNRAVIGSFSTTTNYWTSNENTATNGHYVRFSDGYAGTISKGVSMFVRCVRR